MPSADMVDSEIWPGYGAYPPAEKTDSEVVVRVEPEDLDTGGYAMIRSMPCKLTEVKQLPRGTLGRVERDRYELHLLSRCQLQSVDP